MRDVESRHFADERAISELREQFIAILGHDLRNPLQAVVATGELLERRLTGPVLNGMAARIKTNFNKMSALINDVTDFVRIKLGSGVGVEFNQIHNIDSAIVNVIEELQDAKPLHTGQTQRR